MRKKGRRTSGRCVCNGKDGVTDGTPLVVQWLRLPSSAGGVSSIPGQGVRIPYAQQPRSQDPDQRQYCNKFNVDLESGPR